MRRQRGNTPPRDLRTYGQGWALRWEKCDYADDIDIHVTICAAAGMLFRDRSLARMICENVEFYCRKLGYRLYGYTLMPDHLHVLLSPADSGEPLSHWLDVFKSYTTHQYMKSGNKPPLWQSSANDHVCRAAETAETVMRYIADNPVRAALVEKWQDWPWTKVFIDV